MVGDKVLLRNEKHFGKGEYRLARVFKLVPDSDLIVRTVVIGVRNRRGRGDTQPLVECTMMGVQRLVTQLLAEEQCGGLAQEA